MQINRKIALTGIYIFMFGLMWLTLQYSDNYLLISFGFVLLSILLILIRFERRKIEARELVLLAVLAAVAAVGRIPFASIPSVQPTTFVIMMAGLVFGAESGFMVGVIAALASNMILGQGPWTPWQMVAWGLVGLTSGLLSQTRFLSNLAGKIIFGIVWGFVFGWIMNLWSILAFTQTGEALNAKSLYTYLVSSLLFDFFHSISNVIFLVLFSTSWIKILTRFKRKYGLLEK
jgi:energy-coupling factor transport system substrate-specific component